MKLVLRTFGGIYRVVSSIVAIITCIFLTSLSFSLPFDRDLILTTLNAMCDEPQAMLWLGGAGIIIFLIIVTYMYMMAKDTQKDATIAFDNPAGEVCISMTAIEDFVMRVGREFTEIKSLTPTIKARKEGVDINLKVELWSGMNLPKMTESLQNIVKSQIQNILGIENVHSVQVMVTKIISREKDFAMPAQPDMFHEGANVQQGGEENF